MFERFTEGARRVVLCAQEEARALRHNYIGTEHLLLGLLREEEGVAARALESLAITAAEVRGQVARIVGQSDDVVGGQIPFTPSAKIALELAGREGSSLGQASIGTEHLLLGLAGFDGGVAARILRKLDADPEAIRHVVMGLLSSPHSAPQPIARASSLAGAPTSRRRAPRFAFAARRALILSQEEARALKHTQIDTAHILLGLLREEHGLGARLLGALGITIDDARSRVAAISAPGNDAVTGQILFTAHAKRALESARRHARALEGDVGTEHLLLAILERDDGIARRIVRESSG